jgi:hypothetical protein
MANVATTTGRVPRPSETVVVPTPQELEVTAHTLIAVLGLWLGVTVATRSRALASRVFSVLSLSLVVWVARSSCSAFPMRLAWTCSA